MENTAETVGRQDDVFHHAVVAVGLWFGFVVGVALVVLVPAIVAVLVVAGVGVGNGAVAIGAWVASLVVTMVAYLVLRHTFLGEVAAARVGDVPGLPTPDVQRANRQ